MQHCNHHIECYNYNYNDLLTVPTSCALLCTFGGVCSRSGDALRRPAGNEPLACRFRRQTLSFDLACTYSDIAHLPCWEPAAAVAVWRLDIMALLLAALLPILQAVAFRRNAPRSLTPNGTAHLSATTVNLLTACEDKQPPQDWENNDCKMQLSAGKCAERKYT